MHQKMGEETNARVRKELDRIAAENGGTLRPGDVVKAAEPKENVLHKYFEWDEGKAAAHWRLYQARQLISVVVTVVPNTNDDQEIRAFVSLKEDRHKGIGYRPIGQVLDDKELTRRMLIEAYDELTHFHGKYATIEQLAPVITAIEEVVPKPEESEEDQSA